MTDNLSTGAAFVINHKSFHQINNIYPLYIQCEATKIAKLVYNSKNYGLWNL